MFQRTWGKFTVQLWHPFRNWGTGVFHLTLVNVDFVVYKGEGISLGLELLGFGVFFEWYSPEFDPNEFF
jgi:hypothetical protein